MSTDTIAKDTPIQSIDGVPGFFWRPDIISDNEAKALHVSLLATVGTLERATVVPTAPATIVNRLCSVATIYLPSSIDRGSLREISAFMTGDILRNDHLSGSPEALRLLDEISTAIAQVAAKTFQRRARLHTAVGQFGPHPSAIEIDTGETFGIPRSLSRVLHLTLGKHGIQGHSWQFHGPHARPCNFQHTSSWVVPDSDAAADAARSLQALETQLGLSDLSLLSDASRASWQSEKVIPIFSIEPPIVERHAIPGKDLEIVRYGDDSNTGYIVGCANGLSRGSNGYICIAPTICHLLSFPWDRAPVPAEQVKGRWPRFETSYPFSGQPAIAMSKPRVAAIAADLFPGDSTLRDFTILNVVKAISCIFRRPVNAFMSTGETALTMFGETQRRESTWISISGIRFDLSLLVQDLLQDLISLAPVSSRIHPGSFAQFAYPTRAVENIKVAPEAMNDHDFMDILASLDAQLVALGEPFTRKWTNILHACSMPQ